MTYLGRLVPVSRWVRLLEGTDRMHCCNGFKYDTYKDGFPAEPTAAVHVVAKRGKKGIQTQDRQVVGVTPDKAIWRDLPSLLVQRSAEGLGGPLAMDNANNDREFDFHVCAMIRDQASMDVGVESVFRVSPALKTNVAAYREEVQYAELASQCLRAAIEVYRIEVDGYWRRRMETTPAKDQTKLRNRLSQTAFLSYWTAVEKSLPQLMAYIKAIGTDNKLPTQDTWRNTLRSSARDAYRTACSPETPRQIRAFAEGWKRLLQRRDEPAPVDKEDS
jgi:CRISPR system Cascade subunit CasA